MNQETDEEVYREKTLYCILLCNYRGPSIFLLYHILCAVTLETLDKNVDPDTKTGRE